MINSIYTSFNNYYLCSGSMKKLTLILLICIYSVSTFGVGLKSFYCCGKLKSVTVMLPIDRKEKCDKGNEKRGCCKTTYKFFKVAAQHFTPGETACPNQVFCALHVPAHPYIIPLLNYCQQSIINGSHAPPLYTGVPVYISNRVFRI